MWGRELLGGASPEFRPSACYYPEPDALQVYIEDDDYLAVRIDDVLTVYERRSDRRVVGLMLKGVRELVEKANLHGLKIDPGGATAAAIILSYLGMRPGGGFKEEQQYKQILSVADQAEVLLSA